MNHSTSTFVLLSFLWLFGGWAVGLQSSLQAESVGGATESLSKAADSLLLDQYPDAYVAYSLRKLRSDYTGPAIRVRRTSDGSEQDIGFDESGWVDTGALTSFVGSSNGEVVTWYAQVSGENDLTTASSGPLVVENGSVIKTAQDKPILNFREGDNLSTNLNDTFVRDDFTFLVPLKFDHSLPDYSQRNFITFNGDGVEGSHVKHFHDRQFATVPYGDLWNDAGVTGLEDTFIMGGIQGLDERWVYVNSGEAVHVSDGTNNTDTLNSLSLGDSNYRGRIGEIVIFPKVSTDGYLDRYDNLNADWEVGPTDYDRDAVLPQTFPEQVTLRNWLETITVSDVTIPTGKTFEYDNSHSENDELADRWLLISGLSASAVVRGEPEWWVLDAGNGKGIEATGEVRVWIEPDGINAGGNPPRSWENEPAWMYQLDIPLSDGGQGNPYYQMPELGRRAMISAIVDLIMHLDGLKKGSSGWFDMVGKSFTGMAEAYRYTGHLLPTEVQEAFESGMEKILDHQIDQGPRAANTNMDMFMMKGAAEFWKATDDTTRQQKCVQVVKRALFGKKDGALETNHEVFAHGAGDDGSGGVFSSAGFIMEGDQPEIFYGGESLFWLMGAYATVMDRSDGSLPSEWQFLEEPLRRLNEWRAYQMFHTQQTNEDVFARGSGTGFGARTNAPVPAGQHGSGAKRWTRADVFDEAKHRLRSGWNGDYKFPSPSGMESSISATLSDVTSKMSSVYTGQAPKWSGWSPWTKPTPYLPPEGWYSRLRSLVQNDDPLAYPPAQRDEFYYNKPLGGPPLGKSWWAYKDKDGGDQDFGFFVEAMPQQGNYGGYYGGKIETFWTEEVGYVISNRRKKDFSWNDIEYIAAQHTWGRDESGDAFSTARLRGWDAPRTVNFDTEGAPPSVEVTTPFNSGATKPGEENDGVLEGEVDVTHRFEARANGARVEHVISTDKTDEVTELWATIPFFLREDNQEVWKVGTLSIQYWDGSAWQALPEDTDSDGVPEVVTTTALRLVRSDKSGVNRYAYVSFTQSQDLRLSTQQWEDSYQTDFLGRNVHIDLHGDPGTAKTLPASKSVSYTLQTTDPTTGDSSTSQVIPLQNGWNIMSTSVSPATPAMDSVFAGLQSEITVVENEAGERYRPDENINEIGQWSSDEAYLVHVKSDVVLTIQGDSLDTQSIPLEEGWNLVPYFPSSPLPVEEAVSSILEDLGRVKDEAGRAYLPEKDPDVLEQMEPGKGYKIYVRQPTTLDYPNGGN